MRGRFQRFSGEVHFDDDLEVPHKIVMSIDSESIFTGNKMRDQHLRGKDFFNINKYKTITFLSDSIQVSSPGKFLAIGFLTIKGVKKKINILFRLSAETLDGWGKRNKFAAFNFDINRKDFNIKWNKNLDGKALLVGDIVKVNGNMQLQPQGEKTAFSKHLIPNTKKNNLNKKKVFSKVDKIYYTKNTAIVKKKSELAIIKKSWSWYMALTFLGLLAFSSILIFSFYGKKVLPEDKSSTSDILTDLLVIALVFLFALSFWIVGWG